MCSATVFFVGLIPDGFQPSGGGRGPKYTENRVCIYYRVKSYMLTKYFNRTILCNGSQPAGDAPIAPAIGVAGLRCGRLRPARPKGRKVSPSHLTVGLIVRVAVSPNRRSSQAPSNLFVWPRRQEEAGTATHPRRTDATGESHRGWLRLPPRRSAVLSQLALLSPAASVARMAERRGG